MLKKVRKKSPLILVAMDFGYTLLVAVVLLGMGGRWMDQHFKLGFPLFMILGGALGLAIAFNGLFRRVELMERQIRKAREEEKAREAELERKKESEPK